MKPKTANWLKIAKYDLSSARGAYKTEHYLKVYENCHSALEKLMKGIISEQDDVFPPKVHDLLKLVSIAVVDELKNEVKQVFDELNKVYIVTRYPEDFDLVETSLTKEKAKEILDKVERIFKWLEAKIN